MENTRKETNYHINNFKNTYKTLTLKKSITFSLIFSQRSNTMPHNHSDPLIVCLMKREELIIFNYLDLIS